MGSTFNYAAKQLLARRELTLEDAEAMAVSADAAENDAKNLSSEAMPLVKVQASRHPSDDDAIRSARRAYRRCGSPKHDDGSCGWAEPRCYCCGVRGFWRRNAEAALHFLTNPKRQLVRKPRLRQKQRQRTKAVKIRTAGFSCLQKKQTKKLANHQFAAHSHEAA